MANPNATTRVQTNPLTTPELIAKLRPLARRNALAWPDGGSVKIITDDKEASGDIHNPTVLSELPLEHWQVMLRKGWVVEHETREGWRISNAGTIAIKKARSRTPDAAACAASDRTSQRAGNRTITGSSGHSPRRHAPQANRPGQNDCESPLHWLSRRRDRNGKPLITNAQLTAGERLRADFTYGAMMPSITSNWSAVPGCTTSCQGSDKELELRDGQLRARERFRSAIAAVGPEFSGLLVDVCCYLKGLEEVERASGWPQRSAKIVLLLGLNALARHYGLSNR